LLIYPLLLLIDRFGAMIYIIDDDKSVRRGFEMFLKSAELDLTSFENAEAFLSEVKPQPKDILILDLHLPGMNGCELLNKLKANGVHIPVIIVTAFDEPESRNACKEYGVIAFMRKPVDSEALLDLITYSQITPGHLKTDKKLKNNVN
jgi:FixJ family two-component response regulator